MGWEKETWPLSIKYPEMDWLRVHVWGLFPEMDWSRVHIWTSYKKYLDRKVLIWTSYKKYLVSKVHIIWTFYQPYLVHTVHIWTHFRDIWTVRGPCMTCWGESGSKNWRSIDLWKTKLTTFSNWPYLQFPCVKTQILKKQNKKSLLLSSPWPEAVIVLTRGRQLASVALVSSRPMKAHNGQMCWRGTCSDSHLA